MADSKETKRLKAARADQQSIREASKDNPKLSGLVRGLGNAVKGLTKAISESKKAK